MLRPSPSPGRRDGFPAAAGSPAYLIFLLGGLISARPSGAGPTCCTPRRLRVRPRNGGSSRSSHRCIPRSRPVPAAQQEAERGPFHSEPETSAIDGRSRRTTVRPKPPARAASFEPPARSRRHGDVEQSIQGDQIDPDCTGFQSFPMLPISVAQPPAAARQPTRRLRRLSRAGRGPSASRRRRLQLRRKLGIGGFAGLHPPALALSSL